MFSCVPFCSSFSMLIWLVRSLANYFRMGALPNAKSSLSHFGARNFNTFFQSIKTCVKGNDVSKGKAIIWGKCYLYISRTNCAKIESLVVAPSHRSGTDFPVYQVLLPCICMQINI